MNTKRSLMGGIVLTAMTAGSAQAANIMLTGHDVLLHNGQNGFDLVAMDFLRNAGTEAEIAKADYNFAVVGSAGSGSARFTGGAQNIPSVGHGNALNLSGSSLDGYGSAVFLDAQTMAAADLTGLNALVVLSHTSCGGCSLTNAGSSALNALSADIASAFNDGMDIWGLSGANLATYYEFLPPGAVATGAPISGASGFDCTPEGAAIGLQGGATAPTCPATPAMINGFPTHNRFPEFSDVFTVFEVREGEAITIGVRDATIIDDVIVADPPNGVDPINGVVSAPATTALFGLGLAGLVAVRRRCEGTA